MQIGFWQILLVVVVIVLLFGRGKISALMGDVAAGIKNFRKGMAEEPTPAPAAQVTAPASAEAPPPPAAAPQAAASQNSPRAG